MTTEHDLYDWDMVGKNPQDAKWYFDIDSADNPTEQEKTDHEMERVLQGFRDIHGKDAIVDPDFKDLLVNLINERVQPLTTGLWS